MPLDGPRSLWRIAVPAFGPTALSSIGIGAVLPIVAVSARDLGASLAVAASVVAALGVGQLLTALPAGSLVARLGERRVLILAASIEAAGMLGAAVAQQLWQLATAVLVLGMTTALFRLARLAYLAEAVPLHLRARALSTLGGVHRIGLFIGPLIGAGVISVGGLRAAYLVGAVTASLASLLVLLTRDLNATPSHRASRQPYISVRKVLITHRHALSTLGTGMLLIAAARASRTSLVPLWAASIGLLPAQISLVFAVAGAAETLLFYPAGAVMDRFGRVWAVVPSVLVLGLGLLALPLTGSFASLTAVAVVIAAANGMGSGIGMTLGADAAPPEARAQFLGGWRLLADFGSAAGPLLASGVIVVGSLALACATIGTLAVLSTGWLARWVTHYDPRHRNQAG